MGKIVARSLNKVPIWFLVVRVGENAAIRADENVSILAHPGTFEIKCIKFLY